MKVMYKKYGEDYEGTTLQELQRRLNDSEYQERQDLSIFLITLDDIDVENNVIYLSEQDAYDY